MSRPTQVTVFYPQLIVLKMSGQDAAANYLDLGFQDYSERGPNLLRLASDNAEQIFRVCETLRDMGVPFKHNRTGGADYFVERNRDDGNLQGKFKRLRVLGDDWNEDAPYVTEEF